MIHELKNLADLDPYKLKPIYDEDDLAEPFRVRLKMEFATTETEVHQEDIGGAEVPAAQELLSSITNKVVGVARLPIGLRSSILRCGPT